MTTSNPSRIEYPQVTIQRAQRALKCSPFRLKLFQALRDRSIPLAQIAHQTGVDNEYTTVALSELKTENELAWLIQVGLLRREVDGQGITDSFRLTPLGRQIIAKWEQKSDEIPVPSFWDRIKNFLARLFRLPF
jgi:hypothetical protein